jgi:hypothetical protein
VGGDKMELPEAMNQIMEDAKAQAAQDQAAQQQASASDQALAGSAPPALGGPIPGPSQGQTDLATLMTRLRQPARTIVPMRGTQQGAV